MQPVVQLEEFAKIYRAGDVEVPAVRGVSMTVFPGEFVAVMGTSGSGKSTLMNTIGCLDRPTRGHCRLDGQDTAVLGRNALADLRNRKLGFVFQNFNLLARASALENIELPLQYARPALSGQRQRERAFESLKIVGLEDRADHHPGQLSGGEQQRVAIARALVNDPKLLLADEPTGNLDTSTSIEIMGIFQLLNRSGMTIVMVTHELDIARYCQRVVVMRDGWIINDHPVKDHVDAVTEWARHVRQQRAVHLVS